MICIQICEKSFENMHAMAVKVNLIGLMLFSLLNDCQFRILPSCLLCLCLDFRSILSQFSLIVVCICLLRDNSEVGCYRWLEILMQLFVAFLSSLLARLDCKLNHGLLDFFFFFGLFLS